VAVGARGRLAGYNVFLGPAERDMPVAREVARAVRASSPGGLRGVKALAFEVDGLAQVSMNLVEPGVTTMLQAFERVRREAEARGARVTSSELVGLAPEAQLTPRIAERILLRDFEPGRTIEGRIRDRRG